MLSDVTPVPSLAVSDLERARAFYEGVLGFAEPRTEFDGAVLYQSGESALMVYLSQFAGTNKATAVGYRLGTEAFDDEVARLRAAGVGFITFDMEGTTWDDGVAVMAGGRIVWFADPDGNIFALDCLSGVG
jgi:catechol 2,3-dioxygenase-like lactoylglutathione lyase family enzyme